MVCKVKVSKNQLDYFRKLARKSKKEIQAYLVGTVVSPELTIIERFEYTSDYAEQTEGGVNWYKDDVLHIITKAEKDGLRVVGDIHSHPNWDAVLSPTDYKAHINVGNRISGLCSVLGRKTRVRFWIIESALPCIIEYK